MGDDILIGITMDMDSEYFRLKRYYIEAVERAGAVAITLAPSEGSLRLLRLLQGLIISGGGDIPPEYYGEKPSTCYFATNSRLNLVATERIKTESRLLENALKLKMPLLGICYGMQLINVFFGGTLHQHIEGHKGGFHDLFIEENDLLPSGTYRVNSSHHQAIKDTGSGIRVFGVSPDGVIEAITHIDYPFIFGLQWHPERLDDPLSRRVFERFVEISRKS